MEHEDLKSTLQHLHQQLRSGEPIDPQIAALLQQISQDIHQLTAPPSESPTHAVEQQSLMDRLLGLTEEFEETHPQLAEAIGRVATALSRIGI